MQKNINKKILITGGGSGGHVSVALAIIEELEKRYTNAKDMIMYLGGDLAMMGDKNSKSIEERRMEGKDIRFEKIRAGKLQRTFSFSAILLLFRSFLGLIDAFGHIKEFKPDLIISSGGFVSVPVSIVAWIKKIPLYLHEQTAAVGLSNNLGAKVAKKIFVAFNESRKYFPKEKTSVVGNPVRKAIFEQKNTTELTRKVLGMKKEGLPIIYISGGGLGSHVINMVIRESLIHLLPKYQIILQTGDNQTFKDFDVLTNEQKKLPLHLQNRIYITKYVQDDEIGIVFDSCDFFIGRAGANTVYELGLLRKPCILIPIPWVTHNEQEKNARILEKVGLGEIILEGELLRENFISKINQFNNSLDERKRNINKEEIEKIFVLNAVEKMIDQILG